MATWPCHVILLVITLNNILPSPPIALTYHFCFWRLALSMHQTSFIYLLKIDFSSSHCWNAPSRLFYCPPIIFPFVGKRPSLIQFRWELDLLLQPYNCEPMTRSSYRSSPARSVASHKALGLWNSHAGGESTTCWTQQVWLSGIRSAQLQFNAIAREKLTCCHHAGFWYLVNE